MFTQGMTFTVWDCLAPRLRSAPLHGKRCTHIHRLHVYIYIYIYICYSYIYIYIYIYVHTLCVYKASAHGKRGPATPTLRAAQAATIAVGKKT